MDLLFILLLVGAVVLLMRSLRPQPGAVRGGPQRRQLPGAEHNKELAERRWAAVRRVAEEDVTQLGQQIAATPVTDSLEPEAAQDFDEALNAYERAKEALEVSTHPDDLQWVTRSLDDGRFALAKLEARRTGKELPNRRPPCFFDQRHGQSIGEAQWAPPEGALRDVPVCAACDARIKDGLDPQARMVPTASGEQRPYYEAGAEYAPYMRGWYAASGMYMMSNILMGTMLMNAMYLPPGADYFGADGGDAGDAGDAGGDMGGDGGDAGGDFGGGDFGGGDMGGGDFGGFDFGGF